MKACVLLVLMLVVVVPGILLDSDNLLNKQKLIEFYRSQYIDSIGLLRAAVTAYPDNVTVYIANDNALASRALAVLGDYELSSKILTKLNNEYGGGWNGKVDILLGKDIPDTFYGDYKEYIGEVNGYIIRYEKLNYSRPIHDWYNYADLLVYHALDRLLWGSRPEAELAFLNLTRMWDGYGFYDRPANESGEYEVYKCALFIYLYRALEAAGSEVIRDYKHIYDKCLEVIAKAQDPVLGGIHTHYRVVDGEIEIIGDVNVETTSIVVLSIYSNYPVEIGLKTKPKSAISNTPLTHDFVIQVLVLGSGLLLVGFAARFVKKRI